MSQVLVNHKVNDYTVWKEVFDGFSDFRKKSGEKSFLIMHPNGQPNDLTLLFEWDTAENARKFMDSGELKSAMQKGGVSGAPDIQFFDEAAHGTP